jgi:hypothetical protein
MIVFKYLQVGYLHKQQVVASDDAAPLLHAQQFPRGILILNFDYIPMEHSAPWASIPLISSELSGVNPAVISCYCGRLLTALGSFIQTARCLSIRLKPIMDT